MILLSLLEFYLHLLFLLGLHFDLCLSTWLDQSTWVLGLSCSCFEPIPCSVPYSEWKSLVERDDERTGSQFRFLLSLLKLHLQICILNESDSRVTQDEEEMNQRTRHVVSKSKESVHPLSNLDNEFEIPWKKRVEKRDPLMQSWRRTSRNNFHVKRMQSAEC